ncbi:MAG: hypothetical protein MJZ20_02700 [Bacteroidaceae bacterium]|nr:hypothetical protein [Bacteroidaceae bacterium]
MILLSIKGKDKYKNRLIIINENVFQLIYGRMDDVAPSNSPAILITSTSINAPYDRKYNKFATSHRSTIIETGIIHHLRLTIKAKLATIIDGSNLLK